MSQNALKAVATGKAPTKEKPTTIAGLMADPSIKVQIALALPKHMTADRLARIATTEIRKIPKLMQCDQHSFLSAIMQCAQLGLEPGGALGHAYLIPFDNRKRGITEVQFIIAVRGAYHQKSVVTQNSLQAQSGWCDPQQEGGCGRITLLFPHSSKTYQGRAYSPCKRWTHRLR